MSTDSRSQRKMELLSTIRNVFTGDRSKTDKKRTYAESVQWGGGRDIDSSTHSSLDDPGVCGADVGERDWQIEVGRPELEKNKAEIQKRDRELKRTRQEKYDLEKRLRRTEHQMETLNQSLATQKRYIDQMNENLAGKETLLQTRTKELTGAQTFLTKEDAYSGADAIAMVEALNNEMLQAAAYIADSYESDKVKDAERGESDELREACARANDILGENTIELLGSVFHEDDPLVLEIALQSTMASLFYSFIGSWHLEDPQKEKFLVEIYEGIRETEEQAVSGRWRSLTRSQIHRAGHVISEESLVPNIVDQLVGVLVSAGWEGSYQQVQNVIRTRFSGRLAGAAKWAIQLQKVIQRDITSSDFDVICPRPETLFNPDHMDDPYAEKSSTVKLNGARRVTSKGPEQILCTTELGLRRRAKDQKGVNEEVLLKPKVMLVANLPIAE